MPKQTLKRRADGRYQKRITLSNGKTRLVYGHTEAELKAAVRSVQAQDEAGLEVGDHTLVGEWAKIWLRSYKQGLRPATTKMYRDAYNLHIMQHIGCMELQEVRPVHIRAIMAEITEQSESLQHKVLITVRQIMQTAQANHLIRDDPTDGIRITTHARPKQKKYLTSCCPLLRSRGPRCFARSATTAACARRKLWACNGGTSARRRWLSAGR